MPAQGSLTGATQLPAALGVPTQTQPVLMLWVPEQSVHDDVVYELLAGLEVTVLLQSAFVHFSVGQLAEVYLNSDLQRQLR